MKIVFVSSMHPGRDKRVFDKEARSLALAGHQIVHLFPGEGAIESDGGIVLIPYKARRGILGRMMRLPTLFLRARRLEGDCYHCNEVDSWMVGVLLKVVDRKLVVFDVHEHYPSTFAESRFPTALRPAVEGAIRILFRLLLPLTDRIVLAKRSVAGDFAGYESRTVLVQNFVPLRYAAESTKRKAEPRSKGFTLVHLGVMSRLRGWPQLLAAVAALPGDIRLVLVGEINDGSEREFREVALGLGIASRIECLDWMPFEEAFAIVRSSNAGLILFQPGIQNHVYALPHKMFDYMLAGIPVIAPAFAEEVASIVRRADCGVLVDSSDPVGIARAIERLRNDPSEAERLGRNGARAVHETFNWEREAQNLVRMYEDLEESLRPRGSRTADGDRKAATAAPLDAPPAAGSGRRFLSPPEEPE